MKEFRKIVSVHPLILYRDDLLELEKILTTGFSLKEQDLKIDIISEYAQITGNSFDDLFAQSPPKQADKLFITAYRRQGGSEIKMSVRFTFAHNFIDYQISGYDETWFLGMISQLNHFFVKRKPWYSFLNKSLPFLSGVLICISMLLIFKSFVPIITNKDYRFMISSSALFLVVMIITIMGFKQILFPYVKIYTCSKEQAKINYELLNFIVAIVALLLTISGIVISLLLR